MSLIPVLAIFFLSVTTASGQCPAGCFCLAGYVTCSGLKTVPSVFPDDTRSISITKIDADEIPAGIFDKLPALESIEIYSGSVGKILSGAFSSLSLLELISLNELTIGTIESFAFNNITDTGTISLYMSTIGTIEPYAFSDMFALDEIKLFMVEVTDIGSFALSNIDELMHFSFYTNDVESMQPYAFSNFSNVLEFSMYLNDIGYLGCGSVGAVLDQTEKHSFYSNSVNCSCDLTWISHDLSLKEYLFSNWCLVPGTEEKVFWEDVSLETMQCGVKESHECPPAASFETLFSNIGTTSTQLQSASTSGRPSSPGTAPNSIETSSEAPRQTFEPKRSTRTETNSGSPRTYLPPETTTSTASSEASRETHLPQRSTSTAVSSEAPRDTRRPSVPAAQESVTKRTFIPEFPGSTEAATTAALTTQSTTIDVKLDVTKHVTYHTNPKVVIPDKTEEIKTVTGSNPSKSVQEPQNVSFKTDNDDVNGSNTINVCIFLMVLALAITVI